MFASDDDVAAYVKSLLAKADGIDLKDYWTTIIAAAHIQAYQWLLAHWLKNGYTPVQIALWDFGSNYEIRLAGFFSIGRIAPMDPQIAIANYSLLDPRKELVGDKQLDILPMPLITSGNFVDPEGHRGQVNFGEFDTSQDTWIPDDPDDVRTGQVTRT